MTTKTTYKVEFGGATFKRTTEATYTHAAYRGGRFTGTVTFHKTYAAAKRKAGAFGYVKPVEVAR